MDEQERTASCGCKVGRAIEEFDLAGVNEEFVRRWTGPDGESVRALTDEFNRRILETVMESAGESALEPEVETTYRLLQDDEVSSGMRVTKRRQLERASIDVEEVTSHFISHQTLYRHLTDCLEQSAADSSADPAASAVGDVTGLMHRTEAVVADRVARLAKADELDHEEYRTLVDISLTCERCGDVYEFAELVERGGCGCER